MATNYTFLLEETHEASNVFNNKENGLALLNVSGDAASVGPTRINWLAGGSGVIKSGPGEFSVDIPKNTFQDGVDVSVSIIQTVADVNTGQRREFSATKRSRTPKPPTAKNCYPNQGFVNRKLPSTFGWEFYYEYNDYFTPFRPQVKANFKWRVKGSTVEKTIENFATTQSRGTVPANTFPEKSTIEWCVSLSALDTVGAWSAWNQASTTDAPPTAPTRLLPNGEFFESGNAVTFTWLHNISTASPQYAFDLAISRDNGGSWISLASHIVTGTQKYTIPPDAVPTGKVLWRVRTYNTDDVASPWSQPAQLIVIGAPETPAITMIEAGKSRPMVVWNAISQECAQVVVEQNGAVVYDSDILFGAVTSHKVAEYLADGDYLVKVRVQNSYELWSEWAAAAHTIATPKRYTVRLTGVQIKNGVQLTFEPVEGNGGA